MAVVPARSTLVDQVYDAVLEALCEGELRPGDRVRQEALAARFDVSRQPVIQALALLKARGFLRAAGRKGLMVATLDGGHVRHLYEVRGALERLAVRQAAGRADPALRRQGEAALHAGRRAIEAGDRRGLVESDLRFHRTLWSHARNPVIGETIETHWDHLRWAMRNVLAMQGYAEQVLAEHAGILDAVCRGEADEAEARMQRHLEVAAARLAEHLGGREAAGAAAGERSGPGCAA